ncbi:hypothetical protein [Argonema antarcticum]|uniref:hypothetical protein n=1 Tax=Argonema antarcticum TaxID=2942763 RepID=UPI00201368DF|nr:hypothetical protein [Argonema antarcticum]MCL1472419.1 hypothetical protein [Argonema antarcticum A004/B2]
MFADKGFQKYFSKRSSVRYFATLLGKLTISLIVAAIFSLLSCIQPVFAQSSEQPQTCGVGVYLLSLGDFDVTEGSFRAEFWIWVNCPTKMPEALQLMDFTNSKEINISLDSAEEKQGVFWANHKVQGVFKHDWNIANFPFDRHVLEIKIEHGQLDVTKLVYKPQIEISKYRKNERLSGWQITKFSIQEETKAYDTTYGDPSLAESEESKFSRIVVAIEIERSSFIAFLKLTTAVYIAVAIAIAIYLVSTTSGFELRISTLVGALFAIVVNQQVVDSTLGLTEDLKLVDKIHITAMVYVLIEVIVTIISFLLSQKGQENTADRLDKIGFYLSAISFVVINIILVMNAARIG